MENPPSRRLKPSLLKKHWRREGKNEVIGRKPTVAKRRDSVTVTSGDRDHNIEERGAKSSSIVTGYVPCSTWVLPIRSRLLFCIKPL